jgi:hypothetical protein
MVGSQLTAVPGAWGPSPVSFQYQWKRNGVAISGATHSVYRLVSADLGAKITVTVTGSKTGYVSASKTSSSTATVKLPPLPGTLPTPTITGTVQQGFTLTATPGTWPAGVTVTYQWKRNGAPASGANNLTYTLGSSDIGKNITFTATGSKTGYTSASMTSAGTGWVMSTLGHDLKIGAKLTSGHTLYSGNGNYRLVQQADGNLVLFNRPTGATVWATGTLGEHIYTVMQADGSLVQKNASGTVVWTSGTSGSGAYRLSVLSDGNVVLLTAAAVVVWETDTTGG